MPALIDDPSGGGSNPGVWSHSEYDSNPTSIYLIGLDGKFEFLVGFALNNWERSYDDLDDKIAELLPATSISSNSPSASFKLIDWSNNNGKISISVLNEGKHSVEIVSPLGKCVLSQSGFGEKKYSFIESVASGLYLIKVKTDKQILVKQTLIKK